jgi:hypothetical protein
MMDTKDFLIGQIGDASEGWQRAHREAMACYDLEETIDNGLQLFTWIRHSDVEWTRAVKAGRTKFDLQKAKEIIGHYNWWLEPSASVVQQLEKFVAKGYTFGRREELRQAIELAIAITSLSPERLAASRAERERGEAIPLQEVFDGAPCKS